LDQEQQALKESGYSDHEVSLGGQNCTRTIVIALLQTLPLLSTEFIAARVMLMPGTHEGKHIIAHHASIITNSGQVPYIVMAAQS
jgi:hypothetical protein